MKGGNEKPTSWPTCILMRDVTQKRNQLLENDLCQCRDVIDTSSERLDDVNRSLNGKAIDHKASTSSFVDTETKMGPSERKTWIGRAAQVVSLLGDRILLMLGYSRAGKCMPGSL